MVLAASSTPRIHDISMTRVPLLWCLREALGRHAATAVFHGRASSRSWRQSAFCSSAGPAVSEGDRHCEGSVLMSCRTGISWSAVGVLTCIAIVHEARVLYVFV